MMDIKHFLDVSIKSIVQKDSIRKNYQQRRGLPPPREIGYKF